MLLLSLCVTEDERFLVKTMRKSEMNVLLEMLPAYHDHVMQHPHTLITRFFGLHRVKPLHGSAVSRGQVGWVIWGTICLAYLRWGVYLVLIGATELQAWILQS